MAARQGLECDHCHRPSAEATKYRMVLSQATTTGDSTATLDTERDLCKRCYDRLANFVQRGLTPPAKKEK